METCTCRLVLSSAGENMLVSYIISHINCFTLKILILIHNLRILQYKMYNKYQDHSIQGELKNIEYSIIFIAIG